MKALASDALASSSESFLKLAKSQLEQLQQKTTNDLEQRKQAVEHLVAPIKESLTKVDGKLQELEVARTHAYSTLSSQVQQLAETQKELRSETGNLVSALRDRPNVRGRWGEIQLRRVVEMAGMLEHCDFQTQQHVATDDGRLRPDLVVKMPGGGSVVVDAKFAGQAYIESLEARTTRRACCKLHDHARQVRDHVVKLGAKNYWAQFERAPDFVVLFLPGETFLSAALEQDPALLEDSYGNRVLIATPTTLIGAPAHGRLRLAAGDDRRVRQGGQRPRPRALQAARDAHRALLEGRRPPPERGQGVQRQRRLVRAERPPRRPAAEGPRHLVLLRARRAQGDRPRRPAR